MAVAGTDAFASNKTSIRPLIAVVEALSASLLLFEICILIAGVVSRYVFHEPLVWVDELASCLFVWLSMLGAVVALDRGQHMRLTLVVDSVSERARPFVSALPSSLILAFLLAIIWPAVGFVQHESFVLSPALEMSGGYRAAGLLVGFVLMALVVVADLWRSHTLVHVAFAAVVIGLLLALLWVTKSWLISLGTLNLIVFFGLGVGLAVALGVPIAFAFAVATIAYVSYATRTPLTVITGRMDEGLSHLILLAIPLFVVVGTLMEVAGLARAMIAFLLSLLGHVRGGLYYVLLGGMYLVSGISGAKVADMAAVAPVLFPEMQRRKYDRGEMVALLAASGAMAETIPPSLVLITIGSVTGVSISALFSGGLLPALLIAVALAALAYFRSRKEPIETSPRADGKTIRRAFWVAAPALILPLVIRAAVVEGVATATEVATLGIVYTLLVGTLVYRDMKWRRLYPLLVDAASMSGSILLPIATASAMGWGLTQSGFSSQLATAMSHVSGGGLGFIFLSVVVFTILGSVLEGIPALVLFGPLLFPVARTLGVDEVQYAIVVILSMGVGLFAPPLGVGYYIACAIGQAPPAAAMRKVWGYMLVILAMIVVIALVPPLSTLRF